MTDMTIAEEIKNRWIRVNAYGHQCLKEDTSGMWEEIEVRAIEEAVEDYRGITTHTYTFSDGSMLISSIVGVTTEE